MADTVKKWVETTDTALAPKVTLAAGSAEVGHVSLSFTPVGAHNDGLTISSATTITTPSGATKLMIQALDKNVRFTLDGTAPTTSKGFQLYANDPPLILPISASTTVKVIEEGATADLQYQFGS